MGVGQMCELCAAAAAEPGSKAQVFEPSIQTGNGIEVDVSQGASRLPPQEKHFPETTGRVRNKRLFRTSAIVFGPRTLMRTWGTRIELWGPSKD